MNLLLLVAYVYGARLNMPDSRAISRMGMEPLIVILWFPHIIYDNIRSTPSGLNRSNALVTGENSKASMYSLGITVLLGLQAGKKLGCC